MPGAISEFDVLSKEEKKKKAKLDKMCIAKK